MSFSNSGSGRTARRITIRGVVQGVGFRPFVYRAAQHHHIGGWVLNDATGVEVHAEGVAADLDAFVEELRSNPPPAASIADFAVREAAAEGFDDFQIRTSQRETAPTVRISPDLAVCSDCLRELSDRRDRRYRYPYINCTNCGPRYSIIRSLPYDRANTTMAAWKLCPTCRHEYENPLDRRYHAQPTACAACGPDYSLIEGEACLPSSQAAIARAAELLRAGAILAVKGIGGYHLACDAGNPQALSALRERKFRKEKPFALMGRDLDAVRRLVRPTDDHERLLADRARPIVLVPARAQLSLVAPDNDSLGVMLPYAPLHFLLFEAGAPDVLVLTSANRSSEPIAYRDDDARQRLAGIADAFLIGQRPIARRVDDSVLAVRDGRPFMVRRARGYAPAAVCRLPCRQPILALGADLKNSVTLVVDGQALVSQHLGDLDDYETGLAFEETVHDLLSMYEIDASELTVVHDLHPQFVSTRFAAALPAARRMAVQHHQAHVASVLAEHGLFDERVLGVAFDGTGYGTDAAIWGGEFFVGSLPTGFERCAWLRSVRMPGGDAAARFPVQAAAGYLAEIDRLPDMSKPPFLFPSRFDAARAMVAKDVRCHISSSMGRLFDAVAALAGFTRETTFEGQAAIWLEHQARQAPPQPGYAFTGLDPRPLFQAIVKDRLAGRDPCEIAAAFHVALADATMAQVELLCRKHKIDLVAFSGGVFQNELLWGLLSERLSARPQLRAITNSAVPVNDGGIALGQAALAAQTPA
ncbi:MAG TPA: carbamoyltransferase HypF [Pirellulales bacterium]|nr:carbamoyltransferase HypF [Pirellulales bacterium]